MPTDAVISRGDLSVCVSVLLHIPVFCPMNMIVRLHQQVQQSFYTVSQKTSRMHNLQKHCRIFIIFGRNRPITKKASNQNMLYFPPHLSNASALPCETENTEIVSFHVNVSCWFANRNTSHYTSKSLPNIWISRRIFVCRISAKKNSASQIKIEVNTILYCWLSGQQQAL